MRPFRSALPALAKALLAVLGACEGDAPATHVLWRQGAPGSEARQHEAEESEAWWVANVHQPSVTVLAAAKAHSRRAAVVVIPGGGHRKLVYGPEGIAVGRYLSQRGLTAIVLKYRLARSENSPYDLESHSRADVARAVRWAKHHAKELDIDANLVGVMGFSAGGELASLVSFGETSGNAAANDPIDRHSALPAFHIAIYPGPLGIPERLPSNAPPIFLLAAADDSFAAEPVGELFRLYRAAGRPVELHFLDRGGHGFNLGRRSPLKAVRRWPERLADWLESRELIQPQER